jgi:hypothetical protein
MRVTPIRFTADVAAMQRFLEALGLRPHISSNSGGWVDLRGAEGRVQVHTSERTDQPRQPGETGLSFEADEPLEAVLARLLAGGFSDAHIIDEGFGRSLRVTDPDGIATSIGEPMSDFYGFIDHDLETGCSETGTPER